MCDKAILENGNTLKYVTDCDKNQEICTKTVDNYPHALEFVSECQEMCEKNCQYSFFSIKICS